MIALHVCKSSCPRVTSQHNLQPSHRQAGNAVPQGSCGGDAYFVRHPDEDCLSYHLHRTRAICGRILGPSGIEYWPAGLGRPSSLARSPTVRAEMTCSMQVSRSGAVPARPLLYSCILTYVLTFLRPRVGRLVFYCGWRLMASLSSGPGFPPADRHLCCP